MIIDSPNIIAALEDANVENFDEAIHTNYSGRGMYGDECLGLAFDSDTQWAYFIAYLAMRDIGDAEALISRVRMDMMGLGVIYYFPGLEIDLIDETCERR